MYVSVCFCMWDAPVKTYLPLVLYMIPIPKLTLSKISFSLTQTLPWQEQSPDIWAVFVAPPFWNYGQCPMSSPDHNSCPAAGALMVQQPRLPKDCSQRVSRGRGNSGGCILLLFLLSRHLPHPRVSSVSSRGGPACTKWP